MILDIEQIIALVKEQRKKPIMGIYFFTNKSSILYIGSSMDVYSRIKTNKKNNKHLKGCSCCYISYEDRLDMLKDEIKYIEKYMPKHNIRNNPNALEEMKLAMKINNINKISIKWQVMNQLNLQEIKEFLHIVRQKPLINIYRQK